MPAEVFTEYEIEIINGTASSQIKLEGVGSDKRFWLDNIKVTVPDGSDPGLLTQEPPVITPADGTTFEGTQTVTISCPEGATIYYTTNGEEPTTESTSATTDVELTIDATTTIRVLAVRGGYNDATASATITKVEVLTGIAGVKTMATSDNAAAFYADWTDVVVTGVNGDNVYMQDATAGILLYLKDHGLAVGDKISGRVSGEVKLYRGVREITALDLTNATKVSGATVPAATEVTVAQLTENYDQYEGMLVVVKGATVSEKFTNQNGKITQGSDELTVRAANASITMTEQNTVNVTGYLGKYNSTIQLNVLVQDAIEVLAGKETPTITFANATVSMEVGQKQTITATTDGPAVTYSSSDATVVTVDATTGEVEALKGGSATITASSAENETYYAAEASYTITVLSDEVPEGVVALVAEHNYKYYALQAIEVTGKNALSAKEIHVVGGKAVLTNMDDLSSIAWYIDKTAGTIKDYSQTQFVKGTGSGNLSLSTSGTWTWDESNNAFVLETRSILYRGSTYNYFKNFAASNANTSGYSDYTHPYTLVKGYQRDITVDGFGTICLPYDVAAGDLGGATVYEAVAKRTVNGELQAVILKEVTELVAGKGYIFQGTAANLVAAYSGDKVTTPVTGGAIVGTLDGINTEMAGGDNELTGKYMLSGGVLYKCEDGCWLNANRAYVDVDQLPEATSEVRGIELGVDGATAIGGVQAQANGASVDVFTLTGVRVRAAVPVAEATKGLPAGAYIVGKDKVIVK